MSDEEPEQIRKLFIGGLSYTTTEERYSAVNLLWTMIVGFFFNFICGTFFVKYVFKSDETWQLSSFNSSASFYSTVKFLLASLEGLYYSVEALGM